MSSRYVLQQDENGNFIFHLEAHTGEVLLTSELYPDKDRALRRISAARMLAAQERNFEIMDAANGGAYFLVKNVKGEVIAHSDIYPDPESLQAGIQLVKGKTRGARLEDLSDK